MSLNLGAAVTFVTGAYPSLKIQPTKEVGVYPISVIIKDTKGASPTFKFQITVENNQTNTTSSI